MRDLNRNANRRVPYGGQPGVPAESLRERFASGTPPVGQPSEKLRSL